MRGLVRNRSSRASFLCYHSVAEEGPRFLTVSPDLFEQLTKREIEILHLLAEGLSNKEIAYRLSISEKTVKNHLSSIFSKLQVNDRMQALIYAYKHNLIPPRR
jgi:DNA-binding NarL/FixJ family response regulator